MGTPAGAVAVAIAVLPPSKRGPSANESAAKHTSAGYTAVRSDAPWPSANAAVPRPPAIPASFFAASWYAGA